MNVKEFTYWSNAYPAQNKILICLYLLWQPLIWFNKILWFWSRWGPSAGSCKPETGAWLSTLGLIPHCIKLQVEGSPSGGSMRSGTFTGLRFFSISVGLSIHIFSLTNILLHFSCFSDARERFSLVGSSAAFWLPSAHRTSVNSRSSNV